MKLEPHKAIEAVQNMAQWMIDNGADEDSTNESLDLIEKHLRKLQEPK